MRQQDKENSSQTAPLFTARNRITKKKPTTKKKKKDFLFYVCQFEQRLTLRNNWAVLSNLQATKTAACLPAHRQTAWWWRFVYTELAALASALSTAAESKKEAPQLFNGASVHFDSSTHPLSCHPRLRTWHPNASESFGSQKAQLCALAGQQQITALPVVLTATISWVAAAASWQLALGWVANIGKVILTVSNKAKTTIVTTSEHTVGTVDTVTNLFAVSEQAYSPLECETEHVRGRAARPSRLIAALTAQSLLPKTRLHSVTSAGGNYDMTTLAWRRAANERARWRNLMSQWLPSKERKADVETGFVVFRSRSKFEPREWETVKAWNSWNLVKLWW